MYEHKRMIEFRYDLNKCKMNEVLGKVDELQFCFIIINRMHYSLILFINRFIRLNEKQKINK